MRVRRRIHGIVFIAVLALLLSLSVAVYRKAFTPVVRVTLETGVLGNQLEPQADVKLRGLLVGEVRGVRADGEKATLDLALAPEHVPRIPADVRARLLPHDVAVLENLRFNPGETSKDDAERGAFADELAS
ncbi:MlaD family protein, partial [Streptomyces sp. NPDC019645]|uniref:MlaD family protein n=1 Tax=Streptomyces sp. NPDC019645 TaxID=3154786 RepID=UPI0033F10FD5